MFKDAIGQEVADELNKRIRELEAALAEEKAENERLRKWHHEILTYHPSYNLRLGEEYDGWAYLVQELRGIARHALEAK